MSSSIASLLTVLLGLVTALQLACATVAPGERGLDTRSSVELYRRATPAKPRIPGEIAGERGYSSTTPPIRLTANDGTGLLLRHLQVRAVIDDPVSLTELHLTFENPHDRVLDGQFELLLPHGAEVSRFAMRIGGQWIESEVVEREQARQVYQAHKHTRRDPALLERERGRRFSGRVFPIAPRERKQIILSYTAVHEQAGGVFRVALAGLARVDDLDVQVTRRRPGADDERLEMHSEHQAPTQDFTVALDGPNTVGLAAGNDALLRIVPIPARASTDYERPARLTVLVDTSASMAPVAQASDAALAELLAALEQGGLGEVPLEVIAFDQTRQSLYRGTIAGAEAKAVAALRARSRLGASDLVAALDAVDPTSERVILIGDGEASAGLVSLFELASALERAGERGLRRLDAIALGQATDLELLERLVASGLPETGVLVDAQHRTSGWVDELLEAPAGSVDVEVAGAQQVWPASFDGLRPGQSVLVHARFDRAAPARAKLSFTGAASTTETVELRRGDEPLIARSIAVLRIRALIAELEAGSASSPALAREIVELSKQHGLLGDHTAMLVLESERAYAQFGIDRSERTTMTVDMDRAKKLPVGGSGSRDFTAVVDLVPTAGRDAAGISLAGTSGAESGYTGSQSDDRRSWKALARGQRVGPRVARLPKPARRLERDLDAIVQRCTQHLAAATHIRTAPGHALELTIALHLDDAGELVEVHSSQSDAPSLLDCVGFELRELAGDRVELRPAATTPAFELVREYRVEINDGSGRAPHGWRHPQYLEYLQSQPYVAQSGATGWAKFIEEDIEAGLTAEALDVAWTWHQARPGEVLPYISLGHALAAAGEIEDAARAYGSLIDLYPARAANRRFAGALLESLDDPEALTLAIDSYRKARALRPDHPSGYQALALALARQGDARAAVDVLLDALDRTYANNQFGDAVELIRRDLATLAAAAILAQPASRNEILTLLVDTMIVPEAVARDWLTLSWESDASHLQLHVSDGLGDALGAMSRTVGSGFGPQTFEGLDRLTAGRAWVSAHDLGPEGAAMGCVRRVRFDAEGLLEFDTRPFVIWPGQARVDLGVFDH